MDVYLMIPAGGAGTRFGGRKQFALLGEEPLLHRTVRRFLEMFSADSLRKYHLRRIIVAASISDADDVRTCLEEFGDSVRVVVGGASRAESVRRAYASLETDGGKSRISEPGRDDGYVLVHDACRPFFSEQLLLDLLNALEKTDFALPALPVTDTLKDRITLRNIPREDYVTVQTPQVMHRFVAERIYSYTDFVWSDSERSADVEVTDDATLAGRHGFQIATVPGDPRNIKITHPGDLEIAHAFLPMFS